MRKRFECFEIVFVTSTSLNGAFSEFSVLTVGASLARSSLYGPRGLMSSSDIRSLRLDAVLLPAEDSEISLPVEDSENATDDPLATVSIVDKESVSSSSEQKTQIQIKTPSN